MAKSRSLKSRITWAMVITAAATAALVALAFFFLMRSYIITTTYQQLKEEATATAKRLGSVQWNSQSLEPDDIPRTALRPILGSKSRFWVLVGSDGKVVATTLPQRFPVGLVPEHLGLTLAQLKFSAQGETLEIRNQEYLLVGVPVKDPQGAKGLLIVASPLMGLVAVSRGIFLVLLRSLAIAGLGALGLGWWLSSRLARSLQQVKQQALQVGERRFNAEPMILTTGDEIEELSRALQTASRKLAEYDQAQKRFLSNASHELKTPLMSIQGYAEGIKDGVFAGDEEGSSLDLIIRESGRLKSLVDELLYLVRLESVQDVYRFTFADLQRICQEVVETAEGLTVEKSVKVTLECPSIQIQADQEKLHRAILNLVGNAVRHATGKVNVGVRRVNDNEVIVQVSDDGPGFSAEDLAHLFDRFYRGKGGSSGLGMAIVKAIVEGHGGSIVADNGPHGAIVTIKLSIKPTATNQNANSI